MSKANTGSQVISVRLSEEQIAFLNEIKAEMEADLETEVSMGTVVKRLVSRHMSKRKGGTHQHPAMLRMDSMEKRLHTLEQRIQQLENN